MQVQSPFKGVPPKNTRISPGVYADGRGGTVRSRNAPGPVDRTADIFQAVANGGLAGQPQQMAPWPFPQNPSSIDPGFSQPFTPSPGGPQASPRDFQPAQPFPPRDNMPGPHGQAGPAPGEWQSYQQGELQPANSPYAPAQPPIPGAALPPGVDNMPAPQAPPPRGTRISPGIYADGRGGTYRSATGQ